MPWAKDLSPKEIQEIRSLRGKMTQAEIRKKFGIGTDRLYKLWNSAEENSDQAAAPLGQAPTDAAVMRTLGRIEKQIGRLLVAQEGHYENVEELEGAVEQIAGAETNILDNLEAGSQQVRTTAENCAAAAKSGKDVFWGVVGVGSLALSFYLFFALPPPKGAKGPRAAKAAKEPKAATPAPDRPKSGIRAME